MVAVVADTAWATNVDVLNQTVTAPVDADTLVPELPAKLATPIPPTSEYATAADVAVTAVAIRVAVLNPIVVDPPRLGLA